MQDDLDTDVDLGRVAHPGRGTQRSSRALCDAWITGLQLLGQHHRGGEGLVSGEGAGGFGGVGVEGGEAPADGGLIEAGDLGDLGLGEAVGAEAEDMRQVFDAHSFVLRRRLGMHWRLGCVEGGEVSAWA